MAVSGTTLSYTERLQTFKGSYWEDDMATARQLAAIGHVSVRPPLKRIEEGSRCHNCAAFSAKKASVSLLDNATTACDFLEAQPADFHRHDCVRLATGIPRKQHAAGGWPGTAPSYTMSHDENPAGSWSSTASSSPTSYKERSAGTWPGAGSPTPSPSRSPLPSSPNGLQRNPHNNDFDDHYGSPILDLPAEIRLQIYGYIIPRLGTVCQIRKRPIDSPDCEVSANPGVGTMTPGEMIISRTCRMIHAEVLHEMYSKTEFAFSSTSVLYIFLRTIGQRGRRLLRGVRVACGHLEDALAFALLACCENLATLQIMMERPNLMFPGASLCTIDGVSTMLDLSGLTKVSTAGRQDYLSTDIHIIRRELTRPRDSPGNVRFINGIPDL